MKKTDRLKEKKSTLLKQLLQDIFKKENDYTDEDIKRYHEEIYNACGLEKPKVIILDSPFLCKKACLVFSKIDKFIKDETKKYCKKNDKKYLLDHLFENWHNLLDGNYFDNYSPNKDYVIKVLDSHVKKHIENAVNQNHSLFEKVSNFFVSNFKKEKKLLENNKFGVINSFFIEKKQENILELGFELYKFYKDFYDPFDFYDIQFLLTHSKKQEYYTYINHYSKIQHGLLDVLKNFHGINIRDFSMFFCCLEELIDEIRFFQDSHLLFTRLVDCIDFKPYLVDYIDFKPYIEYIAFYNIFICSAGSLQQDQYVFVSRIGNKKVSSQNRRLHSVDDYAYKFLDGTGFYFFRGQRVQENLFKSLSEKKYTFQDFKHEKNEEIKSLVLAFYEEKFGSDFVFNFISKNLMEVDTFVHKKSEKYLEGTKGMNIGVYTLFKDKDKNVKFAYVRCYCPSTDRMFFLGVPPHFIDAKNAIASLCEVPKELKDNLVSIRRQGEIFSFTFDDEGTKKLKEKSIDLTKTVSLTGDEYFSKMEFEY